MDKLMDLKTNEDENGNVVCNSIVDKSYDDVNHEICRLVKLRINYEIERKTFTKELEQQTIELRQQNQIINDLQKDKQTLTKQLDIEKTKQITLSAHLTKLKETLSKIQNFSETCKDKVRVTVQDKKKCDDQYVRLNDQFKCLTNQFEELLRKHADSQEMYGRICDKYKSIKIEFNTLHNNFQSVSTQLFESEKKLDLLTNQSIEDTYKFDDLFKTYNELKAVHENKVEELNIQLVDANNKIAESEKLHKITEVSLADTQNFLNSLQNERIDLLKKCKELENKVNSVEEQYLNETAKSYEMENRFLEQEKHLEATKFDLTNTKSDRDTLIGQLKVAEEHFENEKNQLVSNYTIEIEKLKSIENENRKFVEKQFSEFEKQLEIANMELLVCKNQSEEKRNCMQSDFEKNFKDLKCEYQQKMAYLQSHLENEKLARQTVEDSSVRNLNALQQDYDKLRETLENQIVKLNTQIQEQTNQFDNERDILEKFNQNELNKKNLELENLMKEKNELHSKLHQIEINYNRIELEFKKRIEDDQMKIENLEMSFRDFKLNSEREKEHILEDFEKQFQKQSAELSESATVIKELELKMADLSNEYETLKTDIVQKNAYHEKEVGVLKENNVDLGKFIEQMRRDHTKELTMLANDKKGFCDEQIRVRNIAEVKYSELRKDFDEKINGYQSKMRSYETEIANLNKTKEELFKKMDENYTKMREEFNKRLDEKVRLYEEQCGISKNYQKISADFEKQTNDLKVQLSAATNNLKLQVKKSTESNAELKSVLQKEYEKSKQLESEILIHKEHQKTLDDQLQFERSKHDVEKKKNQTLIQDLTRIQKEVELVRKSVESKTIENNSLKMKCMTIQKEKDSIANELMVKKDEIITVQVELDELKKNQEILVNDQVKLYANQISELKKTVDLKQFEIDDLKVEHVNDLKNLEVRLKKEKADEIDRLFQAMQGRFATLELQSSAQNTSGNSETPKRPTTKTDTKQRIGDKRFKALK